MATKHDLGYKELFSYPKLVQELLENFVPLPFVKDIDFSTLERLDKSYVTRATERRESDVIYKVNFKGKEAYIYLLLEFQSSNDYWMGLRILRYICEFYSDLTKNFKASQQKLPVIFPIMLYNGDGRWTAPTDLSDLIESYGLDKRFVPQFSYFKIAENEFSEETLLEMKNAIAAIFYAERSEKTKLKEHFTTVIELLRDETPDIINAIEHWLFNFIQSEEMHDLILEKFGDIKEGKNMLATAVEGFAEIKIQEGIERGIERGMERARLEDAKNFKKAGVAIDTIVVCTGLPKEVIEKL